MTTVVFRGVTYPIGTPAEFDAYMAVRSTAHAWTAWSDRGLAACFLSRWRGHPKRCRWCNAELPARRRRWCSGDCESDWRVNHFWTAASYRRRRLDGDRCTICRVAPREAFEAAVRAGDVLHARRYLSTEVHHRVPILGRHGEAGCHHHQEGLTTLCRWHHVLEHHEPKAAAFEQLGLV